MSLPDEFDVVVRHESGRLLLRPVGELDIATVPMLRRALTERAADEAVVLDLSGLGFLDTSGLQMVVEISRRARDDGFTLTILRGDHGVQRVFEIAGLAELLPFADGVPGDDGAPG